MAEKQVFIRKNYANIEPTTEKPEKKQKKRVRYSIFLLTWNSNKPISDTNDPVFQELEAAAEKYWTRFANNIKDYITILEADIDKIKAITVDPAFEIGSQKRCFHTHIIVRVEHYAKVRLDLEKIRGELPSAIPMCNGYINTRVTNDSKMSLENYIHKYNDTHK